MNRIVTVLASLLVAASTAAWAQAPSAMKLGIFDANRVSEETELEGLDGPEMGTLGYPDFALHPDRH